MASDDQEVVVFVHGWSVTHTNTYGGLPERLRAEAGAVGLNISVREIYLGEYVSFRDEVRLEDISRGFDAAVRKELSGLLADGRRFACITHSTGGPVVRDWWNRYYASKPRSGRCPMSHLIMLAPANFGSALAQLGKGRLSRIKTWSQGVEPGTGVLEWLELGSREARKLNESWIETDEKAIGPQGIYPFVITGQTIDRKLYDHVNSYTGELGSDGVVRVASANLNSRHVVLEQEAPTAVPGRRGGWRAPRLVLRRYTTSPRVAMRVLHGKSHSGASKGIMRSVRSRRGRVEDAETVDVILRCLVVRNRPDYAKLCDEFDFETAAVQAEELIEIEDRFLLPDSYFIHDRFSMVIFRLRDDAGHPIEDVDLVLTAGKEHDPNRLPKGFFVDRQRNTLDRGTLTYYLNYDIMVGTGQIFDEEGGVLRPASRGAEMLGLSIRPMPTSGFVHYLRCDLQASRGVLRSFLKDNETTMVDIVLRRIVREGVFRLKTGLKRGSFEKDPVGGPIP